MKINYNNLWKLLIDRSLKKTDLITMAGIGPATLAKMGKNQTVSMEILFKICNALDCGVNDICEFIK